VIEGQLVTGAYAPDDALAADTEEDVRNPRRRE
jgi:hypothetical protein